MDAGAAIGIGSAVVIGIVLLLAIRRRGQVRPAELEQDPTSQYSPAGAAIVKGLRESEEANRRAFEQLQDWR